ncbi:ribonuclease HI family protein, partial [Bartonella sp. CL71SXKL]|uniref:ribonuclease HI family protein n=1 Tax=Bartonella sp. CL71SXKL TaxID=3243540 RepID=UPI0035CEE580
MEKWSVELNRFHIEYEPRTAIKAQVLADFIAELSDELVAADSKQPAPTGGQGEENISNPVNFDNSEQNIPEVAKASEHVQQLSLSPELEPESQVWSLHVDGASNAKGAGIGIVLRSPEGLILEQAIRLGFDASNNEAEDEALIRGLKKAKVLGVKHLKINCDSQLVANQLTGEYCARNQTMEAY